VAAAVLATSQGGQAAIPTGDGCDGGAAISQQRGRRTCGVLTVVGRDDKRARAAGDELVQHRRSTTQHLGDLYIGG
jgi:hypothetical protein